MEMIITIDSNILLSIFANDSQYNQATSLMKKYYRHEYIINSIIYIKVGLHFDELDILNQYLKTLDVTLLDVTLIENIHINYSKFITAWKRYLEKRTYICPSCGIITGFVCPTCNTRASFRQKILPDFIIADFVIENSDGIITIDPNYYRNDFSKIRIFE